jgi:hypothetical protein
MLGFFIFRALPSAGLSALAVLFHCIAQNELKQSLNP